MCCSCAHSSMGRYSPSILRLKAASAGPCSTYHCACLSCVAVCRSGSLPCSSAAFFGVVPAPFRASRLLLWAGPLSRCSLHASLLLPVPVLSSSRLTLLQRHALSPLRSAPAHLRASSVLPLLALLPLGHAYTFSGFVGPRSHFRSVSMACAALTLSTSRIRYDILLGLLSGHPRRPSSPFYRLPPPRSWRDLLVRAFPPWSSPFGDFLPHRYVARIPPQSAPGSRPATRFLASS